MRSVRLKRAQGQQLHGVDGLRTSPPHAAANSFTSSSASISMEARGFGTPARGARPARRRHTRRGKTQRRCFCSNGVIHVKQGFRWLSYRVILPFSMNSKGLLLLFIEILYLVEIQQDAVLRERRVHVAYDGLDIG